MSKSLLFTSRIWHRRIASVLFIFFFVVAATGFMLGWKSLFSTMVFEDKTIKPSTVSRDWLPLDSLETLATLSLSEKTAVHFSRPDRAEIRMKKGYIDLIFKKDYYVRVDGASGSTLLIEKKYGGWIQDLHDGAIIDEWFSGQSGIAKKIYSSVISLALLLLTVSGFYLWYKPRMIRKRTTR